MNKDSSDLRQKGIENLKSFLTLTGFSPSGELVLDILKPYIGKLQKFMVYEI